jgi:hypothetical protein
MSLRSSDWILIALFVAALAAATWGMFAGRRWAMETYGGVQAQGQWDNWRDDVKQHASAPAPVRRKVPASVEPPALVLMRDYFPICLVGALGLTAVLAGTFLFFVRGALRSPSQPFVDCSSPEP